MTKLFLSVCLIITSISGSANAKEAPFCSSQILAHPTKSGYTWTLASRLGELLGMAEDEYGERDKSWTILGIEFTDRNQPRNWHPFDYKNKKNIIIQLTKRAAHNEKEALFQLSHEVFHSLIPTGGNDATFFEEGLATYFSITATRKTGIDITPNYIASKKYRKAYNLVKAVYQAHPDAGKRITAFRKKGIHPSALNRKHLMTIFPKLSPSIAKQLARKFKTSR